MPERSERAKKDTEGLDYFMRLVEKHELELHGQRGLFNLMTEVMEQLKWTNRAMWGMVAAIIVGILVALLEIH